MSKIYLQTKKVLFQQKPMPSYAILDAPPEKMSKGIVGLEPDECVDVCRCVVSEEKPKELHIYIYRVANMAGQVQEQLLEHFFLENWR